MEGRRPVEVLPERCADALAERLTEHPGVDMLCRDRARYYADGADRAPARRRRSRTGFTSGRTSARRPNGWSPARARSGSRPCPRRGGWYCPTDDGLGAPASVTPRSTR
ncbi:hypothetical protein [Streptomyces sp. 1331.2]|uniref:hypothetical protein n=1 Tax=Streptomyces sp. 1331.2 TaxID=1938835 RepID=UPI00359C9011